MPLGVAAAIATPGMALLIAFLLEGLAWPGEGLRVAEFSGPEGLVNFARAIVFFVAITSWVTVPAAVVLGLPMIGWFLHRRWFSWRRHAIAGFVIGALSGFVLSRSFDVGLAVFGGFGAVAVSAYWLVAFGARSRRPHLAAGIFGLLVLVLLLVALVFRAKPK